MKSKDKYMYELCLCGFFFKAYVFIYLHQVLVEAWGNFGLCCSLKGLPARGEGSRPLTRDQTQALCWDCGVLATEPPVKPPVLFSYSAPRHSPFRGCRYRWHFITFGILETFPHLKTKVFPVFELCGLWELGDGTSLCVCRVTWSFRDWCEGGASSRLLAGSTRPCSGWLSWPVPPRTSPCLSRKESATAGARVLPSLLGSPVSLEPGTTPGDARVQRPELEGKSEQEERRDHGELERLDGADPMMRAGWGGPDGADPMGLTRWGWPDGVGPS